MGLFTFKGGVHPYDGKDISNNKVITPYLPKGDLVYPLNQHIGAPAIPVVKKGDQVKVGQLIAKAGGFVSANIHSSVSGVVKAIDSHMTISGNKADAIVIENDHQYEEIDFLANVKPLETMTKEEIRTAIQEAGIVGQGGAGFPTHVKLAPKNEDEIDRVVINCAECEPYITCDYRRMMEVPEQIIDGIKVILALFPKAKAILAVEDNKKDAIQQLQQAIKAKGENRMEVKALKTKYPQGAERQLIYASTGRAINASMLPADANCVVQNVETVLSIYRAIYEGKPVYERPLTVTGDAVKETANLLVRTGTNSRELIEAVGGFVQEPEKVISGGPMMGIAISTLDVPCTKTASALLCFKQDPVAQTKESACINCGRCVQVCPGRIVPSRLADFSRHGDLEKFEKYNGTECCECGCCSFVCPAKRHLAQAIKTMRKTVLANRRK